MKKKMHLFALLVVLLAGCSIGPEVRQVPKWEPPPDVPKFGDWRVNPETCTLHAASGEIQATSDGIINRGVLSVQLKFLMPLVKPPIMTMSSLPVPLPFDGSQWEFRTYLAYDANTVAHMLRPGTFLMVAYQPMNSTQVREVHFETRGLVQGAIYLGQSCK
jgi:hypothetical protein